MGEITPDTVVPTPESVTDITPRQFIDWHLADSAYQHGFARHYLKQDDHKAAAEAFMKSIDAFTSAHLARALMEYAPDKIVEVLKDLHETIQFGDAMEWVHQWLAESGIDASPLVDAGSEKAKESGTSAPEGDLR